MKMAEMKVGNKNYSYFLGLKQYVRLVSLLLLLFLWFLFQIKENIYNAISTPSLETWQLKIGIEHHCQRWFAMAVPYQVRV